MLLGRGESAQVFSAEETSGQQRLRVQEPGIQRERTRGAVGGAQTVGGRQRQDLPGLNALTGKRLHPLVGSRPKRPAGRRPREGRDVQQDPGASHGLGSL